MQAPSYVGLPSTGGALSIAPRPSVRLSRAFDLRSKNLRSKGRQRSRSLETKM